MTARLINAKDLVPEYWKVKILGWESMVSKNIITFALDPDGKKT